MQHTLGTRAKTKKTRQSTRLVVAEPTSAFVPWTSKCCGQSGSHHGFDDCCLLKTSRVCAEVPSVAIASAQERPMMMVCARWRGAGLIFILPNISFSSLLFFNDGAVLRRAGICIGDA